MDTVAVEQGEVFRVGIQAEELGGSWHERALREYWEKTGQFHLLEQFEEIVVPYSTHEELIEALGSGAISSAIAAVDNPYSGRVESTVNELRDHEDYTIDAVIGIRIPESEIYHEDVPPSNAKQVMSQEPALNQVRNYKPELVRREHNDTFGAAIDVLEGGGYINGVPTIAVGSPDVISSEANKDGKLKLGEEISEPDNMTQFWMLSRHEADPSAVGEYASFVMSVGNGEDDLLEAVEVIAETHDLDITDIDCHLSSAPLEDAESVDFFVTVKLDEGGTAETLINDLQENGNEPELIGVYDDYSDAIEHTKEELETDELSQKRQTVHESWRGRTGVEFDDDHDVMYIQSRNTKKSLLGMLRAMKGMRKVDMSRPIVPEGNGARGFYFVLDKTVSVEMIESAMIELDESNYIAEHLKLDNDTLATAA